MNIRPVLLVLTAITVIASIGKIDVMRIIADIITTGL